MSQTERFVRKISANCFTAICTKCSLKELISCHLLVTTNSSFQQTPPSCSVRLHSSVRVLSSESEISTDFLHPLEQTLQVFTVTLRGLQGNICYSWDLSPLRFEVWRVHCHGATWRAAEVSIRTRTRDVTWESPQVRKCCCWGHVETSSLHSLHLPVSVTKAAAAVMTAGGAITYSPAMTAVLLLRWAQSPNLPLLLQREELFLPQYEQQQPQHTVGIWMTPTPLRELHHRKYVQLGHV